MLLYTTARTKAARVWLLLWLLLWLLRRLPARPVKLLTCSMRQPNLI